MNTFEIIIQRKSGDSWPIVVEYSRPRILLPLRAEGNLHLAEADLQQQISWLGQPQQYGTLLGKALFQDEIRDAFIGAVRESEDCLRVLLFIEAADKELRTLRWERLCAPLDEGWQMLALNQRVPFSLYIPATTDRRFPPIGRRDLRALVLVASPSDSKKYKLDHFDVEATVKSVRSALGEIPTDVLANIDGAIGLPTLDELCTQLTDRNKQYTLLHFVSHGRLLDDGETVLYWSKADDTVEPVTATRLLDRLRLLRGAKGLPHFIFLCTCESASPDAEAGLGGLGQRLVRDLGMPAVIAMTEKVTVKTAQALAEHFYKQLRESGEVDRALQEATASLAERQDVTVPALFSRLGGRPLFSDQLDRDLTNAEIKFGLEQLEKLFLERSPILYPKLHTPSQRLTNTLDADTTTLSHQASQEREQALIEINNLALEVLDLSFNAVALGKQLPAYDTRCPFLGLYPFRQQNREFFFGREQLIAQLQQKLTEHNFLAVLGASGSGKSSVVLAGLIPTLQAKQPGLALAYLTPSSNPSEQLQASLSAVQNQPSIIVVDQFEELFTLCSDETQRLNFIQQLLSLVKEQPVIVTMRADFWGECATYRQLKELMESRQKLIGAMDSAELRKAMELQAAQVGLRFEAGLSNHILDDVQGEPGAMPLLQHALLELWQRRHGRWLRVVEYEAIGGVQKAIAQTADDVYNSLSAEEQEQVKNIFVRLTRLDDNAVQGEKRRDTRRRVRLEELIPTGDKQALTKNLLKRLAGDGARLIVVSVDSATFEEEVEVAHEALIRYWPRLITWLDENRVSLQLRETIRQAALEWDKQQKDENYLMHRGGRLEEAQALLKQSGFLNQLESEYVFACTEFRLRQEKEKAIRRRREIGATSIIAGGTVIVFVVTTLLLKVAELWHQGAISEANSRGLYSASLFNSHQQLKALVEGIRAGKTVQEQDEFQPIVLEALQQAVYEVKELNRLTEHEAAITSIAFSPDGKTFASSSADKTIRIWNLHGKQLQILKGHQAAVNSITYSPNGKLLASADDDGTIQLWNVENLNEQNSLLPTTLSESGSNSKVLFSPNSTILVAVDLDTIEIWDLEAHDLAHQKPQSFFVDSVITSVAFSPDGKILAIAGEDKAIQLRNLQGQLITNIKGHESKITSVVFNPDGKTLASASFDHTIKLWDLTGKLLHNFSNQAIGDNSQNIITNLAFSPDGTTLAAANDNKTIKLWNLNTKEAQTLQGHQAGVTSVAFSPDSTIFASAGEDNTIILWNLGGKLLNTLTGHEASVNRISLSPDGLTLASASDDNTVKLWNLKGQLLHTLTGHKYAVKSIVFSPDGQTLASASNDNTIILWNTNGQLLHTLTGHKYAVTNIVFSPKGRTLASASNDNTLKLWDLNGNLLNTFRGHQYSITSFVFSPDGKNLASASKDNTIKLWDFKGKLLQTYKGHQAAVTTIAFSRDGKTLASGSEDNTIKLWNLQGKLLRTIAAHQATVTSVVFGADHQTFVSASADSTVKLWNVEGNLLQTLKGHQAAVTSIVFSPKENTFVSTSEDNTLKLWNLDGKLLQTFRGHQAAVTSVIFSPYGNMLISGSKDKTIKLWKRGKLSQTFSKHRDTVTSVVFSPDGKTFASGSYDKTINLWNLDDKKLNPRTLEYIYGVGKMIFSADGKHLIAASEEKAITFWNLQGKEPKPRIVGHPAAVTSLALSPDNKTVASGSNDKTIKLWTLEGKLRHTLTGHLAAVTSVSFDRRSKIIASGSGDQTIKLWDLKGNLLHTLTGHESDITKVVFSPDGKTLASSSGDKTIKLWDLKGNLRYTLTGHGAEVTKLVFSPDGKTLASGSSDKTIKLWDLAGKLLHTLKGHEFGITSVVFSPDGKTLASSSNDKTIKLWDLNGDLLHTFFGHESVVTSVVFSPDGKHLASGSWDNTVRLWDFDDIDLDELLVSGCDWIKDYLAYSSEVQPSDRTLCDGISLAQ